MKKLRLKDFSQGYISLNWQYTPSSPILNPTYFNFRNMGFLFEYRLELGLDGVPRFHLEIKMGNGDTASKH